MVAGPAGAGKSRLAEECLAKAVADGFAGRRAAASAAARAVPLGAVAHLIPAGVDLSDPVRGFAEVARVLAGPGRERRWAVLMDDVHLLDAASAVLMRQLMDTGVVRLIGTVRSGEAHGEAVAALCGSDVVGRIDLDLFTSEQTAEVLQAVLEGAVGRRTVRRLHTASGGNALYLRELVQGAVTDGSLAFDGEIWELAEDHTLGTPRLAELIDRRLTAAGPAARPVLELLALCEPLPLADAQQAADDPDQLADLEEAGLIRVTTDHRRTAVALAHPLYGETLRAKLPVLRRRQLLLEQADRTQACGSKRREDTLHIAAWQLAATGSADSALLIRAAALARYAHDYAQALTLLQALPERNRTTASHLLHGEALLELGRPADAEEVLAAAEAHAVEEPEMLAVAWARMTNLFWSLARSEQAMAVNDAARNRVHSKQGRRRLRYNEGAIRTVNGEPARGLQLLADLEDDIHDAPSTEAWITGAKFKPYALAMTGRTGEAVAVAERAYHAHLQVADRTLMPHPATHLGYLAVALADHGQLERARDTAEKGYAELTATGTTFQGMWAAVFAGRVELTAGHPRAARRWFAEAATQARTRHSAMPMNPALSGIAICAAHLGDLDDADHALAQTHRFPPYQALLDLSLQAPAWLAAARGDLTHARGLLTQAADQARTAGMVTAEASLLTDAARLGGAKNVTDRLNKLAQACDGTLAPARAHFTAALAADDPDLLLDAARELEAIGADLMAAEAATAAAAAHRRAGHTRAATAATQFAHACTKRCEGARTPLLSTAEVLAQLTARERDIALLAAHGSSSKDIADQLHLSVRTVENHLQHAYTKLGVTTRRALAHALGR
jgi:DNA-binding CsgD family transcriptional regulator